MAIVTPFKAWRPKPQFAEEVACVPYDVINSEEAKALAANKPNSYLHVIRPEIDLPPEVSIYDEKAYRKGHENLAALLNSEAFVQEQKEALYIYKLVMDGRAQTGIFGCVSVADYESNVILKHELTRPEKENDRTKHIITQEAHAEPVMLTFRDSGSVTSFMNEFMAENEPIYDFTAEDEVSHTIWKVEQSDDLASSFASIPKLYIADGHHRCASAARTAKEHESHNPEHDGSEAYNYFPAVLFPMDQMEILAYNRVVKSIPDTFFKQLKKQFHIQKDAIPIPPKKGMITLFLDDTWYGLTLKAPTQQDAVSKLDISLLQQQILEPMLDISDQRTDPNIDFIGGIRGTEELERLVQSGQADLAISLYPTDIKELLEVSDAGLLMPPKSTWFEPKLRSGLLVHTF